MVIEILVQNYFLKQYTWTFTGITDDGKWNMKIYSPKKNHILRGQRPREIWFFFGNISSYFQNIHAINFLVYQTKNPEISEEVEYDTCIYFLGDMMFCSPCDMTS